MEMQAEIDIITSGFEVVQAAAVYLSAAINHTRTETLQSMMVDLIRRRETLSKADFPHLWEDVNNQLGCIGEALTKRGVSFVKVSL